MHWLEREFYGCITPADRRPVIEWAAEHLRFPHSARSTTCHPQTSPWINPVLDAIFDNTRKEVTAIAATQSSKTTLLEITVARIVAEDAGRTMVACQTDEDAVKLKTTRLDKDFEESPVIKDLLPSRARKNKRDAIMFDHMDLFVVGANMNNFQSDSYRWMLLDEGWRYKAGLDGEAVERTTSQAFARVVRTSQGGLVGDDNDKAWKASTQHEWGFVCPQCGFWQPITFGPQEHGGVRYNDVRDARGLPDLTAICASVRYECANPECKTYARPVRRWEDTPADRRAVSMMGDYRQMNPAALPEYMGFHWERTTVYWNEWKRLVTQWVLAQEAKRRKDTGPLSRFIQKVKGRSWAAEREDFKNAITLAVYKPADAWAKEGQINGVPLRFMFVDKMRDYFRVVIRGWSGRGDSRLRHECAPTSWEEIIDLQKAHGIYKAWVMVDSGWDTDEVYKQCARHGWTAMKGDDQKLFPHHEKDEDGTARTVYRYFSAKLRINVGAAGFCYLYRYSNLNIKDTLARLRNGGANSEIAWEVYDGVTSDYLEQMDAETRDDTPDGPRWEDHGRPNHAWDCECGQVVMAYMLKLIGQESVIVPGGKGGVDTTAEASA